MKIAFDVQHHPDAQPAHRYRYTLTHGKNKATSEGYPTHQHVTRAVDGLWAGLAKAFNATGIAPPVPYAHGSLLPRSRRAS